MNCAKNALLCKKSRLLFMSEFEKWVDLYTNELYKRAFYLFSNKEDAEDLVQEVFVAAYAQLPKFRNESSPLTWLNSILRNKAAEFYRKKYETETKIRLDHFFNQDKFWKQTNNIESWTDDEKNLLDEESFREYLIKCLNELPEKWNILVKLTYLEQKKSSEICQETNITATNYWKILQRSRLQLRECLETNWFKQNA